MLVSMLFVTKDKDTYCKQGAQCAESHLHKHSVSGRQRELIACISTQRTWRTESCLSFSHGAVAHLNGVICTGLASICVQGHLHPNKLHISLVERVTKFDHSTFLIPGTTRHPGIAPKDACAHRRSSCLSRMLKQLGPYALILVHQIAGKFTKACRLSLGRTSIIPTYYKMLSRQGFVE